MHNSLKNTQEKKMLTTNVTYIQGVHYSFVSGRLCRNTLSNMLSTQMKLIFFSYTKQSSAFAMVFTCLKISLSGLLARFASSWTWRSWSFLVSTTRNERLSPSTPPGSTHCYQHQTLSPRDYNLLLLSFQNSQLTIVITCILHRCHHQQ